MTMRSHDDERDHAIAECVAYIIDKKCVPVDVLARLDTLGVNINYVFTEASNLMDTI